ncbi:hypothetical protein FJT64_001493 [Amphibalanus amphitrite]|uniref:Uncharacterized protein n=1 Tax=Amphibalanus amphitrite TaxID=1232801 RepID=A0A6A4UYQ5_AMPAM|nr:hypothetical protein FJT64_001493 [Amphibalanus amphitrite]
MTGRPRGQLGCCLGAGWPPPAAGRHGTCCDSASSTAAAAAARLRLHSLVPNGSRWRSSEDLSGRRPARPSRLSLMRCGGGGSADESSTVTVTRSAQQRRAAFSARRDESVAMEAPLVACLLDRTPSVVVSDYSHTNSTDDGGGPEEWSALGGPFPGRRLSNCSSCSCSTVSSCGRGLSQRGSLLDLEAEGLVQCGDGRLERARSPDLGRRERRTFECQGSLEMDCGGALSPWQRSLDLEWSQQTLHPAWTASLEPWRRSLEPPSWHRPWRLGRQRSLDLDLDAPEAPAPSANQRQDASDLTNQRLGLSTAANQRSDLDQVSRGQTLTVAPEPPAADPTRKVSDCSCSSVSTISQEDEDEIRSTCTVEEVTSHHSKVSPHQQGCGAVEISDGSGSGSGSGEKNRLRLRLRLRVKCYGGSGSGSGSE